MAGSKIDGQVGIAPTPSVFYALADIKGDLANGPVTTGKFDNMFYSGEVVIKNNPNANNEQGVAKVFASVDWLGLGMNIIKGILPLIL